MEKPTSAVTGRAISKRPPVTRLLPQHWAYLIVLYSLGACAIAGGVNFAVAYGEAAVNQAPTAMCKLKPWPMARQGHSMHPLAGLLSAPSSESKVPDCKHCNTKLHSASCVCCHAPATACSSVFTPELAILLLVMHAEPQFPE